MAQCPGGTARLDANPSGTAWGSNSGDLALQGKSCSSNYLEVDGLFWSTATYGFNSLCVLRQRVRPCSTHHSTVHPTS